MVVESSSSSISTSNSNSTSSTLSSSSSKSKMAHPKSSSPLASAPLSINSMFEQIKRLDKDLDHALSKQPIVLKLERQSGLKKTTMVYGLIALFAFFLLYRFATRFVLTFTLLAYPLYLSLEAVESHDKAKDAHILSYWSVMASLKLAETILPFIKNYVPFYNLAKLIFAVYLYLPQTKGSLLIYDLVFKPAIRNMKEFQKKTATASTSIPLKKSESSTKDI